MIHLRRRGLAAALLLSVAVFAAPPPAAFAQDAEVVETLTATATVQIVDMVTRQVLLRDDASGEVFEVVAGPEVRNLAQLDPGDVVEVTWMLSVAARMAVEGEEGAAAAVVTGRAAEGEKPGGVAAESVSTVVTFLDYDAEAHVATVEDAEGMVRQILVRRPEMREYASGLSSGDRVEITFTEAIAVGVVER